MSSELRVNILRGSTSNGSITIQGEGTSNLGGATMQLQQGMAKVWAHVAAGGLSLPDSLNCSGIDDDGTGEYGLNFTNNMGSANYSATSTITFNNSGSNQMRHLISESKSSSAVEIDATYVAASTSNALPYDIETSGSVTIHGDLA